MTNAKKISISHESQEVVVLRPLKPVLHAFCGACAEETELLTLDESVNATRIPAREIMRRIETGAIHSVETARGHILICRPSLVANI